MTRQQIRYAFDDVRFLLPLWQRLADRLGSLQRDDWAVEDTLAQLSWARTLAHEGGLFVAVGCRGGV